MILLLIALSLMPFESATIGSPVDYSLLINKVSNITGIIPTQGQPQTLIAKFDHMTGLKTFLGVLTTLCAVLAMVGLFLGWRRVSSEYRARQSVEWVGKVCFLPVLVWPFSPRWVLFCQCSSSRFSF